jgi:hypothetical protein
MPITINAKFKPGQKVRINLGEDGSFVATIDGVAINKDRIFYCVSAGGIRLYTIEEKVIEDLYFGDNNKMISQIFEHIAFDWTFDDVPRIMGKENIDIAQRLYEFQDIMTVRELTEEEQHELNRLYLEYAC